MVTRKREQNFQGAGGEFTRGAMVADEAHNKRGRHNPQKKKDDEIYSVGEVADATRGIDEGTSDVGARAGEAQTRDLQPHRSFRFAQRALQIELFGFFAA